MIALGIVLAILVLLALLPIGARVRYDGEAKVVLAVGPIRLQLVPAKPKTRKQLAKEALKKEKKQAAKAEQARKKKAQALIAKPPEPPKPAEPLPDKLAGLIPWAKLAVRAVGELFHRRLTVTKLVIRAALAGGDPAKTAQTTGRAWEAIGIALPILDRAFRIKKREISIWPDFLASKTQVEAELHIRFLLGSLIGYAVKYGFGAIKILLAQKKAKKQQSERKVVQS